MFNLASDMIWPLLACFILVGIHAYLGIHVIARKVIFVDLALAQIAALGAVYGVFLGLSFSADPLAIKMISVSFTLLGALLFSFTRTHNESIPHEAIIGIIYAAALSLTVLVTSNLPHGSDEVRQMLAGSILWVTPAQVTYSALLYCGIGLIHYVFRQKFFLLSSDDALTSLSSAGIKLWDFIFYATFGIVVTSSVGIGGVLLVFGYLIIPAVIGVMMAKTTKARLMIGWGIGLLASIVGVVFSYQLDLPSGPTIVVVLGACLLLVALFKNMSSLESSMNMLAKILLFGVPLALVIFAPLIFIQGFDDHQDNHDSFTHKLAHGNLVDENVEENIIKALSSISSEEIIEGLLAIKNGHLSELVPKIFPHLRSKDHRVKKLAVGVLGSVYHELSPAELTSMLSQEKDDFSRIELSESLLNLGDKRGLNYLAGIYKLSDAKLAKDDALFHLQVWLPQAPKQADSLMNWLSINLKAIYFDKLERKYLVPVANK